MNNKLFIVFVLCCSLLWMSVLSWASLIEESHYKIKTVFKKSKNVRSHVDVSIKEQASNKGTYDLRIDGKGEYAGYKDVDWISESQIKERDGVVFVERSSTKIFQQDKIIFQSTKNYDYSAKIVSIEFVRLDDHSMNKREFPINGPICDDVTMVYVFNKIIPDFDKSNNQKFYLLTDEPKLYHVMVKRRANEDLPLASGQKEKTAKFQLMADLGPLTELASKMVPPTYVWFPKNDLSNWVQYEGMETGYETANIMAYRLDVNRESLAK